MALFKNIKFNGIAPVRLDVFLAETFPEISRSLIKKLILEKRVKTDGIFRKPSFILEKPCGIEINWPSYDAVSAGKSLKDILVYEDAHIMVFNKPEGLLVHPLSPVWEQTKEAVFAGEKTLAAMIISERPEILTPKLERAGIVHRLDRDTSGIMLSAKKPSAQKNLIAQFQARKIQKTYAAIACGIIKEDSGIIDVPIGRVAGGKIKASEVGREAITEFKVIKRGKDFSFVELYPKTGRTNQLRVHLSWLGHPVLGDGTYRGKTAKRLMLHSKKVIFTHPSTKKKMTFGAAYPQDFAAAYKDMFQEQIDNV